ncbi:MAG: aminotransferase class V-fold PLP-dependent enzyme [Alphaproteobacteria bacterium]|jgi:selenocysteine lyase/cysteine desulfurase|nr:aminotransferase [Rhodospirillaceae bacterium]MDP6405997.1 aminotransferase class V-fold PLP-dependent enzyme [Alphaproteobacteria bacterium]|tara:strand:- start:362 stop:1495 length:1134 start_codon:yes stop_codon:yes gene_type:complete
MIPCQRDLFDLPDDVAYLNCAYMSPLLDAAVAAGQMGLGLKARPWGITQDDFFAKSGATREAFGQLIGAAGSDVAIIPSVSYGMALAAANLECGPGRRIVVLAEQFPSNFYAWNELVRRTGGEMVTVARPADGDWTAAVLAELDERTAVAALPHCHWTDGGLVDLEAIGARCREVGAALAIDATQSLGAFPFDVGRVRPDFLVAACYKWLLGPYSLGFVYVSPEHHAGRPLEFSWITREDSENFSGLVNYRDELQPGARRYDVGETSNFALMPVAHAALRQILDWGVDEIAATLGAMTADIGQRATALGLGAAPPERRASHFIGLRFADGIPDALMERLAAEQVYVSVRGDSLRVTPHLYNNAADVDRLFGALEAVM